MSIAAGWTATAIIRPRIQVRARRFGGDRVAGVLDLRREKRPGLRASDPGEIGAVAAMLRQPSAHDINGTLIPVDGGWPAQSQPRHRRVFSQR